MGITAEEYQLACGQGKALCGLLGNIGDGLRSRFGLISRQGLAVQCHCAGVRRQQAEQDFQ